MKFTALFFLSIFVVALAIPDGKFGLLLDVHSNEVKANPMVVPSLRQTSPCEKNDMNCWCHKAVEYTNDVRSRNGVSNNLKVGTQSQLDNANRYAKVLGGLGGLQHQSLSAASQEIGCKRFIGGENIAYNYEKVDIAKACVNQWENSSGHLANILGDKFEEVVVGFHFEGDRVYCVQTFAYVSDWGTTGSESDNGCNPAPESDGSDRSGPKPPKKEPVPPTPRPVPPTPKPRVSSSPKPKSPEEVLPKMERRNALRACRCLIRGKRCPEVVASRTGGKCQAGLSIESQLFACKVSCCKVCKLIPSRKRCQKDIVKRLCRL